MVFDPRLGYDPEEWEECAEPEHFLVFSTFTRILLSTAAIAFAYFFFKMVEDNKNKGKKKDEEDESQRVTSSEDVLKEVSKKLEHLVAVPEKEQLQQLQQQQQTPTSVEELLNEAKQYMDESVKPPADTSKPFFSNLTESLSSIPDKAKGLVSSLMPEGGLSAILPEVPQQSMQPVHATEESFKNMMHSVDEHFNKVAQDVSKSLDSSSRSPELEDLSRLPESFLIHPEGLNRISEDTAPFIVMPEDVTTTVHQQHMPQNIVPFNDAFLELEESGSLGSGVAELQQGMQRQISREEQARLQKLQEMKEQAQLQQQQAIEQENIRQQQQRMLLEQLQKQGIPPHLITQYQEALSSAKAQQPGVAHPLDIQEQIIAERQRLQALASEAPVPPPRRLTADAQGKEKRLSADDEKALLAWELERQKLEEDRLRKLQDREVGGEDSSDLTGNSSRALEQLLPASHISYHSASPEEDPEMLKPFDTPQARRANEPKLEQKLMSEIDQLAGAAHDLNIKRESYRDSELTDYDISDFHMHEPSVDFHTSAAREMQYQPGRIEDERLRHTTGDSDDYVKVQAEPIYDLPPRPSPKQMSPEEARALQELYQEYDFGVDILPGAQQHSLPQQLGAATQPQCAGGAAPGGVQHPHGIPHSTPAAQTAQPSLVVEGRLAGTASSDGAQPPLRSQQQVHFEQPALQAQPPFGGVTQQREIQPQQQQQQSTGQPPQQYHMNIEGIPPSEKTNVVNAEMYIQDALEYLGNQNKSSSGGFVMEEDMLSSQGNSSKKPQQQKHISGGADPTTQQVKTTDVFDRIEHDEHDDMTYAPEIQSVEIPPDQMSESSDNLQEYFDRVAAEVDIQREETLKRPAVRKDANTPDSELASSSAAAAGGLRPPGRAPQMHHPSSGKRVASNSSLGSVRSSGRSPSGMSSDGYPRLRKQSSLLSILGVTSMQEVLLAITSLESLSDAFRKAGLESTNLIFGIDYTASNKYQGEESFHGRSLHTIHPNIKNPYQQVISILGRTLAPFASTGRIPVFGFGDAKTGDWSTFNLKPDGDCTTLEEVLKVYNEITPQIELSGPTNFAPLIYQAIEICQKAADYHILVIIADGQVTNERATRRAIVQACQYPLSIIVVGVGDGPWDMMRVFDESLPKRPWDNFHFVEFHDIMKRTSGLEEGDVKLAVQSLLEIPDQYRCICELGLLKNRAIPPRGSEIRREFLEHRVVDKQ